MRWRGGRRSQNVEDRRGRSPGRKIVGGGFGLIVIVVIALLMGVDPQQLFEEIPAVMEQEAVPKSSVDPARDSLADFISVVLADTEDVWREQFLREGRTYREPKLVLFENQVQSACGFAGSATGPFYCPADSKVYLDLDFFRDLEHRLGAPGDFAQAYVIAHEVGHHVQNLLGINEQVRDLQRRAGSRAEANRLMVSMELQADFFAGFWAHHAQRARNILEQGDLEEAMDAASAVGDDRLQKRSRGYIVPDSFTHGTSAQRMHWFRKGFETGDLRQGDTFNLSGR